MSDIRSCRPGPLGGRGVAPLVAMVLLVALGARAGEMPAMDTVLYGASYYHEYMPYERLDQDVELMKRAGVTVVRVGESTWSSWEPREGEFEFAWMDRVIDRHAPGGDQGAVRYPTYSIPPWLFRKHPEILVTRLGGRKAGYGPRQNMDITHPTFRLYAERIIRRWSRATRAIPR